MNLDSKSIFNLYKQLFCEKMDYLNTDDISNYNWEVFEENYSYAKLHLNESFEYLGNDQSCFRYKITTPDNKIYNVAINIYRNDTKLMDCAMLVSRSKNSANHELYQKLYNSVKSNPEMYQIYLIFSDSNNNVKLTNDNNKNNESFVVFRSLEQSIHHFMHILNYNDKVNVARFYVANNELKRIELYKRLMKRVMGSTFHYYLEDDITDNSYKLITLFN
jgi:hypothetical protein